MTDVEIKMLDVLVRTGHVYFRDLGGVWQKVVGVGEADDTGSGMEPAAILERGKWCALWASELSDFRFVISSNLNLDKDRMCNMVKLAMSFYCKHTGRCKSHKVNEDHCIPCRMGYDALEKLEDGSWTG